MATTPRNSSVYTPLHLAFNFFRRPLNERERAVADRLPPGQYLTQKWPVLHYGSVPRVDLATWDFRLPVSSRSRSR